MTTSSSSNYPENFDTDDNLFLVHDSLQLQLVEDYNPGDTSIVVAGEIGVMDKFPPTGIITLTDQCNDHELRAISFKYGSRTETTFDQLELRPGFTDVSKPKTFTVVTMNVFADHHNALKDSCIAIEEFIGTKDTMDVVPLGETLTGRLNYLRKLVLSPRAWFNSNNRVGIAPVTMTITDESFRGPTSWVVDFGDGSDVSSISTAESGELTPIVEGPVPCGEIQSSEDEDRVFSHTYFTPGKYDVTVTVGNKFGTDSVTFKDFFTIKAPAPETATILVSPSKVRTNRIVNFSAADNGEQQDNLGNPIDAVTQYTWKLSDDLPHANVADAVAIYSIGGIYDAKLRVDTELGAYRITTLENAVNVVEQVNLWLMAFDSPKSTLSTTKKLKTYEFGLISESFKSNVMPELSVTRDYTFTSGYPHEEYQRNLFLRNRGMAQKGTLASGDGGQGVLYWAEDESTIRFSQCSLFDETWSSPGFSEGDTQAKDWNWLSFSNSTDIYILFGLDSISGSPSAISLEKTQHNMNLLTSTNSNFTVGDFANGADELLTLADDAPATYRACFLGQNGFFARNDSGPGGFFRIRNFYRTEGTLSNIVDDVRKLSDIPGTARTELEMVSLASGVYVFYNSGEVAAYNPTTNVWTNGGPGIGSAAFRLLQDSSVDGYADTSQTLLAASDRDKRAYLSFDYSASAFIKFNEADLTFTSIGVRPTTNEQFSLSVF